MLKFIKSAGIGASLPFLKLIASIYFFLMIPMLQAQQMTPLGFDNYNGSAGAMLNPAFLTNSKVYLDIHLVTADFFVENNMGYFDRDSTSFRDLIHMTTQPSYHGRDITAVLYENHDKKNFFLSSRLLGPSVMLQTGKMAFGLGFTMRTVNSGVDLPYEIVLSKGHLSDTSLVGHHFDDRNTSTGSLDWAEINLNYAYDLINEGDTKLTVGAGLKVLLGLGGIYAAVTQLNYKVPNKKTLEVENLDAEVAYALPIDYDDYSKPATQPLVKGYGLGLDIGILYTKLKGQAFHDREPRICSKPYGNYIYKLGISLMDIGSIKFNRHAEVHRFDNRKAVWNRFDTVAPSSIHETMHMMSNVFYGDPSASMTNTSFSMSLPTTLSIQYDYHFNFLNGNFYLGAYWQQPLRFHLKTVRQSPVVAVIPRYESRIIGASLPVTFYNYEKLRIGASLRIYSVTVGTEKLGTIFGIRDFTGMDFYFSIRFNLDKGRCSGYLKGACSNAGK